MSSLFKYNLIHTTLISESKTLKITLNRSDLDNTISLELLFEIESILNWAFSRIEINSILIDSSTEYFSKGLSKETVQDKDFEYLISLKRRIWAIQKLMLTMPQAIVCDFNMGACNIAIEAFLGADQFIADDNAKFQFNHFEMGYPLFSPKSILRHNFKSDLNNLLYKKIISAQNLVSNGFLTGSYEDKLDYSKSLLFYINTHSSFTRIQTKMILNEELLKAAEKHNILELDYIQSLNISKDWKTSINSSIHNIKNKINMTLIDGGKSS